MKVRWGYASVFALLAACGAAPLERDLEAPPDAASRPQTPAPQCNQLSGSYQIRFAAERCADLSRYVCAVSHVGTEAFFPCYAEGSQIRFGHVERAGCRVDFAFEAWHLELDFQNEVATATRSTDRMFEECTGIFIPFDEDAPQVF